MTVIAPTADQVARAKEQYGAALEILLAAQRASEHEARVAIVGKCFVHIAELPSDPAQTWPVYIAATRLDEDGRLCGWRHQRAPTEQFEVAIETDLQPGFLAEHCKEIPRAEFIAEFNTLVTSIARYASVLLP